MAASGLGRTAERSAVADFLTAAESGPANLLIEGEAGIGKTTLWLDGLEQARDRGFRVLSAQVGEAETVLAYAAVGDLLGDVEPAVLDRMPDVQRLAVDRVLMRAASDSQVTDQRVAAAALVSVVDTLSGAPADARPVLVPSTTCSGWIHPAAQPWRSRHAGSVAGSACCSASGTT